MPTIIHWTILVLAILLSTACEQKPTSPKTTDTEIEAARSTPRPVELDKGTALSSKPYLREVLPGNAYAYLRIPSAWGLIGNPTGSSLDKAVGSAAYGNAVRSIREGFDANVIPDLPDQMQLLARLLLQHSTSPIEAAVFSSGDNGNPLPSLMISAAVDFLDVAALNLFFEQAALRYPQIQVLEPVQATQAGMTLIAGLPTQVLLDTARSRLFLLTGMALQPGALSKTLQEFKPAPAHVMYDLEQGVDSSGQGFFLWLNVPRLLELAEAMGQNNQVMMFDKFGLSFAQAIGMGVGSSGGIHRFKTVVQMPNKGFRAFTPVIRDMPGFQVAGEMTGAIVLGLPAPQDLAAIETAMATIKSPQQMEGYQTLKQQFVQKVGFSIEDLLSVLGQDITFVFDDAGQYAAVRIKDKQKFHSLLNTSTQRFELQHSTREIAGQTYHHLIMPSLDSLSMNAMNLDGKEDMKLIRRLVSVPSHVYWVEEDDYLIMASLPQVLMDRTYIATHTPIDEWLTRDQRMNSDSSMLLVSVRNKGLPALMYRMNLGMLTYLGDMVERPVDMFALPTPLEAGLPEAGAFNLKLTSSDSQLALELDFESNPAEILLAGNGYAGVAAVGILAAVAVPAYHDYTIRATVAAGIGATHDLRNNLANFALTQGRYPTAEELVGLKLSNLGSGQYNIEVTPDTGEIVIEYYEKSISGTNTLVLQPRKEEGEISWNCAGDLPQKYLPALCR